MTNSSRGPIGLPLRRVQSRNALAMSAIQEERSSVDRMSRSVSNAANPAATPCPKSPAATPCAKSPALTPCLKSPALTSCLKSPATTSYTASPVSSSCIASPSSSCGTSPTTSRSNSDLSPSSDELHAGKPSPVADIKSQSPRSRSIAKFEEVESAASASPQRIARAIKSQSARARPVPFSPTNAQVPNNARAKTKSSSSARTRAISHSEEPRTPTPGTKRRPASTKQKASSARSRPVPRFNDARLDEAAEEGKAAAKATMSLRSHPISYLKDLLATGPTPQELKKKYWKPRTARARSASNPIHASNPLASSSASLDGHAGRGPRSGLSNDEQNMLRSKSSTNLTSKLAKQYRGQRRRFFSIDRDDGTRGRALSDARVKANVHSEDGLRPRASSDSTSIPLLESTTKRSTQFRYYEGKFRNKRGQWLLYFSLFPPEEMAMRGIILHLHGMGDHCRRNTALYERYCNEGFGVITYDMVNHGGSDCDQYKVRAHVSNFDDFIDDTNAFITFAKVNVYKVALQYWREHHHPHHPHGREKKRQTLPELPLIISGASFGSLVGLHTVLSGKHKFHAAVWAGPAIGVTWTPVLWAQWKCARPLIAAFPTAKVIPAIQHNLRSRDPVFLKKYHSDPLTINDMITPRSGHQSLHAMLRLQREQRVTKAESPFCGIPMLFLAGSEDRISDQQAAIKFYSQMESFDKEFKIFDGLYHMVYEEPEKEDVIKYMVNWLHKRFPLETRQPIHPAVKAS